MILRLFVAAVLAVAAFIPRAGAHEVRPAYLELRASAPQAWDVTWRVPAQAQALRLRINARLSDNCTMAGRREAGFVADAYVERWRITCPSGLENTTIRFEGLAALNTDVLLRIEGGGAIGDIAARILPAEPQFTVPARASALAVADTYFRLGVHHILTGADHLMFVLALMLLVQTWRRLAFAVTAFTVGHSLTLGAVTLTGAGLPGAPVEAAIALSIVCAAAEAVQARSGTPTAASRAPWVMAFAFGLLHGLGFAGALRETGLPSHAIVPALFFFNIGVEAGQLLFVGAVLAAVPLARMAFAAVARPALAARLGSAGHVAASYMVGIAGAYWLATRFHVLVAS
jgi:hypothetical protein